MIYLDQLGPEQLDDEGSWTTFLEGKLIQSLEDPPDFVDPRWLSRPDVGWRWTVPPSLQQVSGRRFPSDGDIATVAQQAWLEALAGAKMHPERRRVAVAMAGYADYDTGRNVRPAMATLARQLGKERARVNTHVRRLEAEGWLVATGKAARGVIVYALAIPKVAHNLCLLEAA